MDEKIKNRKVKLTLVKGLRVSEAISLVSLESGSLHIYAKMLILMSKTFNTLVSHDEDAKKASYGHKKERKME